MVEDGEADEEGVDGGQEHQEGVERVAHVAAGKQQEAKMVGQEDEAGVQLHFTNAFLSIAKKMNNEPPESGLQR